MEKAAEIEKRIYVEKHERQRHDFDLTMFNDFFFGIGGRMA